ncbi:MAG: adenylyl-sulfate kinase [Candidatus Nanohaloarchaea archaeon]
MGFTLWFTGLPSSGKSTVAKLVEEELRSRDKQVHNLDGDDLRKKLHPDLGFTREERAINNRRISVIASLLNRHDIATIVAAISPFEDARQNAREEIENEGEFVEIYVDCPVEVAKDRDPKNLYEKAEEGKIENFTGVNHPYEEPENPDVKVNTVEESPEESAQKVVDYLEEEGLLEERDEHTGMTPQEEEETKERLRDLGYL